MTQQIITAVFDNRTEAERAVEELVQAGISRNHIRVMPGTEAASTSTSASNTSRSSSYDTSRDEKGFWASLGDLFLPDEDRYTYAEAMHRGSTMVSVTTEEGHVERVADVLERYGTVNLDEREESWRREGWTGYTGGTTSTTGTTGTSAVGATGAASARTDASATARSSTATGDEVIPVVEEQLQIGKRQVNQGRVRIRSYMVETPVQEQVNLRQEHVHVERRPVDRAVNAGDEALFRERTIEAEERSEEAVVNKEARVKEELVVKKDVEERTQTVQDKVRRTEVEVEDERANRTATSDTTRTSTDRR